ncbi:stalk domain-containing protein [Desulforamulus ruminis]|uniref:Copper amine oxidase-like domain-containing protein n=1 Tax=Desulforamulus ruminis (strain ATCC 23193 / DSM 2154 / NCIMB 8452 / DL) TaxID=696281 RepID=F6DTJ4_DESRL|nr:stalk domain-containing protein [Desulforamulus ruminis]AEG60056.1 copper amine oxidase-like domain-containing protein [Desulforamulus ruminis DSM 2154]
MKKFILGLLCGVIISTSSIVYASDYVQTTLFPAKFIINGQSKELKSEYTILNYSNHVYVPIRFVAENMGAIIDYNNNTKTININNISGDLLTIKDPEENLVRVGNLNLVKDGNNTRVTGNIEILLSGTNIIGANLSFYNDKGEKMGFVVISGNIPQGLQRFEVTGTGDFTNYSSVKLNVGYLNGVKNRVPN